MKKAPSFSRYVIIGLPGSGKSTFAMMLGKKLKIPVCHIDKLQFEPNGKKKAKKELLHFQQKFMNEKNWIIEGCSISTLETRFQKADVVLYFRFSPIVCIWRVLKRLFVKDVCPQETGCASSFSWTLLKYIFNFKKEKEPFIDELRKKYPEIPFKVFRNSDETDLFLKEFP